MDLRQLRYFVAVAEQGGIRRAALVLFVAQPPVSVAIKQLEQELEVQLFERSNRGVELTPEGTEFLAHARHILRSAKNATDQMRRRSRGDQISLNVGLLEGVVAAAELTGPVIEGYRDAHPEITLRLKSIPFFDQVSDLLDGAVDVAVVRPPLDHPDITVVPIANEPRQLWVSRTHAFADRRSVALDDVLREAMVPLGAPPGWSSFWQLGPERGGRDASLEGVEPARAISDIQLLVADGQAAITAPRSMLRLLANPLIRACDLDGGAPSEIAVAFPREAQSDRSVQDFVEHVASTFEDHVAELPGAQLVG